MLLYPSANQCVSYDQSMIAALMQVYLGMLPRGRFFAVEPQRQAFCAAAGFDEFVERRFDAE